MTIVKAKFEDGNDCLKSKPVGAIKPPLVFLGDRNTDVRRLKFGMVVANGQQRKFMKSKFINFRNPWG